ncbi:membrane-fusion protein [Candidatus Scalindua japonica]|uniref:Membrane-fusion protein n=1 Tax=Candidatus Scalindua japonica TaxID=1284222 RepID=A0A286U3G0_9BACT|nr:efflux RND transporter periplasmic adaptor subunit [Candidatus Scalindua japonica]GAX62666.1 membrane-fusion protein [Candidatus Scalindua japonica]
MKDVPDSPVAGQKNFWAKWNVIPAFIGIFVAGLVIGLLLRSSGNPMQTISQTSTPVTDILFWTCSMHPQIKQKGSGRCPICDMDLTPMREEPGGGDKAVLRLGERARHLASIRTTPVKFRELEKSVYTLGKIDYNESRVAHVTAWVSGRIEKLYVDFTGTIVKKGEHLVSMYSPDLLSTQKEYLLAYNGAEQSSNSSIQDVISSSQSLLENTKQRLLLWGITEAQIDELERTQTPQVHLTIYAPIGGTIIQKNAVEGMYFKTGDKLFTIVDLSRVWLYLDIYEYDIPWIRYGQAIEVVTESYPGEVFHGNVVFIDPFLSETTRAVKVRINMDNHEGKLKPGMYVNARLKAKLGGKGVVIDSEIMGKYMCPMHPDVISDKEENCPECGMKLELIGGRTGMFVPGLIQPHYDCPMKCKGSASDEPGNCPKCKMVLIENEGDKPQGDDAVYVCSEHIEIQTGLPGTCPSCQGNLKKSSEKDVGVLSIPHSAVLITGKRNIVYVEKEEGSYVLRDVVLGPKADEFYPVIEGLSVGENVVTEGNFLIDSQMQLLGKPSLLFQEGSTFEKTTVAEKDEELRDKGKLSTAHIIDESILNQMQEVMEDILDNYYRVAASLAADSTEGIDNNLDLIIGNTGKIKGLGPGIPENLSVIIGNIENDATEMKGTGLEESRKKFKDLSKSMIDCIKELHGKNKGAEKMYVYYCPMANASWLQKEEGTRNPYFGTRMLKCGSVREVLSREH